MLKGVGHSLECVLAVRVAVLALWPVDCYAVATPSVFPIAGLRFTLGAFNGALGHYALTRHIEQTGLIFIVPSDAFHVVRHEVFTPCLPAWALLIKVVGREERGGTGDQEAVTALTLADALCGNCSAGIELRQALTTTTGRYAVDAVAGEQNKVSVSVIG